MATIEDTTATFTRLWTKHQPRIFGYIHTLIPNWADAEEVLQETGVVLWKKFAQFDPDSDFTRWGCGVAYFEVLKYRERIAVANRRFGDAFLELVAKQTVVLMDTLAPMQTALNHCVEKLPISDRRLLALRYDSDSTTDCIATKLQRSPDGIRKSLRRVHRALFECVERWRRRQEQA
jgi:RNA polymerase sigma-70 factor, ECF subfamily